MKWALCEQYWALTTRASVDAESRGAAFTYLGELDYRDGRALDALRWQEQAVQAFQAAPNFAAYRWLHSCRGWPS